MTLIEECQAVVPVTLPTKWSDAAWRGFPRIYDDDRAYVQVHRHRDGRVYAGWTGGRIERGVFECVGASVEDALRELHRRLIACGLPWPWPAPQAPGAEQ